MAVSRLFTTSAGQPPTPTPFTINTIVPASARAFNIKIPSSTGSSTKSNEPATQKKRIALLHQAGRILMEDVPFVPLYTLAEIYGVARNVGWKARPDEKILAGAMKIVYYLRPTVGAVWIHLAQARK